MTGSLNEQGIGGVVEIKLDDGSDDKLIITGRCIYNQCSLCHQQRKYNTK
jgi:hypothetical protein